MTSFEPEEMIAELNHAKIDRMLGPNVSQAGYRPSSNFYSDSCLRDPAIQMNTTETNVSACATEKAFW